MAYRRSLSIRATLLARKFNPSFSCISHDNDRTKHNMLHPSGSIIETNLTQRRSFGRYVDNTSRQFTGAFRRTGCGLVGNGMFSNRYMSTSIWEVENVSFPSEVAAVITDDVATDPSMATENVASQAPAMSNVTIAAPDSGLPSAALQYLIDSVHSFTQLPSAALQSLIDGVHSSTGLNWWVSISLATVLIRGLTIPFLIYELKSAAKFELMRPRLVQINEQMQAKGMEPRAVAEGKKKLKALFKEYGVNPNDPNAETMGLLIEGTLICSFLPAILDMVEEVPSLKTGGALWFADLTTPDAIYILPGLTALTYLVIVEFIWQGRNYLRAVLGFLLVPLAVIFPKAVFFYFLPSNVLTLCSAFVLKVPVVKKALGFPEMPVAPSSSLDYISRWLSRNLKRRVKVKQRKIIKKRIILERNILVKVKNYGSLDAGRRYALSSSVYLTWHARNALVMDGNKIHEDVIVRLITTHVFRLLYDGFPSLEVERIWC